MYKLFQINLKSVFIGIVAFCVMYLIIVFIINLLVNFSIVSITNKGIIGKIMSTVGIFPFLAAGFLVALQTHPSGVFNSAIVGIAAGVLTVLFTRMIFNEFPPAYSSALGIFGGISTSLVWCALGGLLGGIVMHYKHP